MRPKTQANPSKQPIHQKIAGTTLFAFLLNQLLCPLPASAQDALRTEPIAQTTGLEQLKADLQGEKNPASASEAAPPVAAGLEEDLVTVKRAVALIGKVAAKPGGAVVRINLDQTFRFDASNFDAVQLTNLLNKAAAVRRHVRLQQDRSFIFYISRPGSAAGLEETPAVEGGSESRWPLAPRLNRLLEQQGSSQPEMAKRFWAIQRTAQQNWSRIVQSRTGPLKIAVVIPAYAGEIPRIQSQDSITLKLEEAQILLENDPLRNVSFTFYVVDDKPQAGLQGIVEDFYARAAVEKDRVRLRFIRLEDAIASGNPLTKGLTSSRESVKWGSMKLGLGTAAEEGADVVVMTDIDSNQRLTEIPNLIAPILLEGYAGVVGSRFVPGAATNALAMHNHLEFFLYNPLVRALMPEINSIEDIQSGFKAFSPTILETALPDLTTRGLAGDSELLWLTADKGKALLEVPRSELEENPASTTINPSRYMNLVDQVEQQVIRHTFSARRLDSGGPLIKKISLTKVDQLRQHEGQLFGILADLQAGKIDAEQARAATGDLFSAGLEEGRPVVSEHVRAIQSELEHILGSREQVVQFTRGVRDSVQAQKEAVAILFDPRLVPGDNPLEKQMKLIDIEGNLGGVTDWPEAVPLHLELLSPAHSQQMMSRGYRVIHVIPEEENAGELSDQALLVVAARAYAASIQAASPNKPFAFLVDIKLYQGINAEDYPTFVVGLEELFRAA